MAMEEDKKVLTCDQGLAISKLMFEREMAHEEFANKEKEAEKARVARDNADIAIASCCWNLYGKDDPDARKRQYVDIIYRDKVYRVSEGGSIAVRDGVVAVIVR